ncbi:MAG: hypothetical protein JSR46_02225 [Verrucomicrobia bacterium]|nr:hypothetical protein [Verrucomicrobiota bacterium]
MQPTKQVFSSRFFTEQDLGPVEDVLTPFQQSSSNSESGTDSPSVEELADKIEKLELATSPAKHRTTLGQLRLNESRQRLQAVKVARAQLNNRSKEEIIKFYKNEINDSITPINTSSDKYEIDTLKNNKLPDFAYENCELSYKIGKALLQPKNGETKKSTIEQYIQQGVTNPKACGEDMWRSMERIKVYDSTSEKPIIDGTLINSDEEERDKKISTCMGRMLNLLFRHVSTRKDPLLSPEEFGCSQDDAGIIGETLARRVKGKAAAMVAQRLLGLGKQELFTQPATWAIPHSFRTVGGTDDLEISEFSPTLEQKMHPLQYNREISIVLKEEGIEYQVEQPITLRERTNSSSPLGTCRVLTIISFDKEMSCVSINQEVKRAKLLET